ncbi:DUF2785 domain-containing protein [Paenibacillus sp. VCA1]|uniref:DUF2785 domain-containing protein n=1 Tax=Paenibacillus sp. VCA1 TaxID=3039148 RepID=UPI0028715AE5|nr:DUF2785 domain-containing protein [Paenibacillus sp. VCA1]MDR9856046.1 DUF2785 domain-containing protein [Paenibacillus sp. VCA1]
MGSETLLKKELLRLRPKGEGSNPDCPQPEAFIPEMLRHIGSTDPELRDDLIYGTICRWTKQGKIAPAAMRTLLRTAMDDNHLFYGIGEKGTDSVFTRSFSALILPVAVYMHKQNPFLSEDELHDMKTKIIRYLALEEDLRGYVEGKGWAHAAAHAADGLESLAGLQSMTGTDLMGMLDAIRNKVCIGSYLYMNDEDERFANAAAAVFMREIVADDDIAGWIHQMADVPPGGSMTESETLRANTKLFLRSLYFKMLKEQRLLKFVPYLLERLNARNNY